MKTTKWILGLVAALLLTSCDPDSDNGKALGAYDNGIFVINEGDFGGGSISFISNDGETTVNNIFQLENPGQQTGIFIQSMFFDENRAFIISNGSNKITVVDRYTFKHITTLETGFALPRYAAVVNGKAYVTNLNTFGSLTDDFVTVIDLESFEVLKTIPMNALADRIIASGGKLYVSNGNFGSGSGITVINATNDAVEGVIPTATGPNSLEVANGKLYVLCGSYTEASVLMSFNMANQQPLASMEMPASMGNAQNLDVEGNRIFFTVGAKVYALPVNATSISDSPFFDSGVQNLYGFSVHNDKIYISDARDFASNGRVVVFDDNGNQTTQYTVELSPNGVYFN